MTDNIWLFMGSVALISLSGVMMPGPLMAATIARGYKDKNAGVLIGLGHGIVELPIIALIYFGFGMYLTTPLVKHISGIAGGLLLMAMGIMMFINFKRSSAEPAVLPYGSLVTGIVMTGANPYIYIWWATIGLALITGAVTFGIYGIVLLTIVHIACDVAWDQIVSMTVFKTKHLWTPKVQQVIFGICAVVLIGFGIYFGVSVFL
jgi:threonine/homoserine/homoserine lactone efflux protein